MFWTTFRVLKWRTSSWSISLCFNHVTHSTLSLRTKTSGKLSNNWSPRGVVNTALSPRFTRVGCLFRTAWRLIESLKRLGEKMCPMTLTMKGCALLWKLFYKNDECALTTIRKFQTLKSIKLNPITTNGLRKMIAKFEETGSFGVQRGKQFRLRQWKIWPQHYKNRRTVMLESTVHGELVECRIY